MTKQNADLVAETAEALLNAIKKTAGTYSTPAHLKDLAEAFALVSQNDAIAPKERRGVISM